MLLGAGIQLTLRKTGPQRWVDHAGDRKQWFQHLHDVPQRALSGTAILIGVSALLQRNPMLPRTVGAFSKEENVAMCLKALEIAPAF